MKMPDDAGRSTTIARFCLAIVLALALAGAGNQAQAASNAQIWPEHDDRAPQDSYSIMDSDVTLTGFHCDVINNPSPLAFSSDPDYRETPFTVGLEVRLEEVSALQTASRPSRMDDASAADQRTPLSARVSRMLVQQELSNPPGDGQMQDVFVPEASMGIADLVALCLH
jgi:hypothetical protein